MRRRDRIASRLRLLAAIIDGTVLIPAPQINVDYSPLSTPERERLERAIQAPILQRRASSFASRY